MNRVVLSESARRDRQSITAYTVNHFGIAQAEKLMGQFEAVLDILAQSPHLGRERPELDPPGHSFRYLSIMKTFVLVYRSVGDRIEVARILHGAQSLAEELDHDSGA